MKKEVIKYACVSAVLTALYVVLVASFLFYVPRYFAGGKPDTVLAPILALMLFVSSAGITGTLVLGRPILWYLEGRKKEAVQILIATLGIFFLLTVVAFLIFLASVA